MGDGGITGVGTPHVANLTPLDNGGRVDGADGAQSSFSLEEIFLKGLLQYLHTTFKLHLPQFDDLLVSENIYFMVKDGKLVPCRMVIDQAVCSSEADPTCDKLPIPMTEAEVEHLQVRLEALAQRVVDKTLADKRSLTPDERAAIKRAIGIFISAMDSSREAAFWLRRVQSFYPPRIIESIEELAGDGEHFSAAEKMLCELVLFDQPMDPCGTARNIYDWNIHGMDARQVRRFMEDLGTLEMPPAEYDLYAYYSLICREGHP